MSDRSLRREAEAEEIVNQHATVTEVTAMDHNRWDEIDAVLDQDREVVEDELGIDGLGTVTGAEEAWDEVIAELSAQGEAHLSDEISSLKQRVERPYPSLVSLRFDTETPLDFVPGQYVRISYEDEEPRVYSIASSPNDDAVELCIRRVPGGNLTPTLCTEAAPGDDLFVRGPFGDEFTLQAPSSRDMVFIATGTGVAPFKSMIDYTFEEGRDQGRDVWLFLGSSWEDHLPYRDAFARMDDERENFHFVPTLSRETYLTDWAGETDYVQQTFPKYVDEAAAGDLSGTAREWVDAEPQTDVEARLDPGSMEVYVCGIGAMAQSVVDVVTEFNLDDELLRMESYG